MVERINNKFICGWCKTNFNQEVGTFNKVTSQVKCPKCSNFLKSNSGIEIKKGR